MDKTMAQSIEFVMRGVDSSCDVLEESSEESTDEKDDGDERDTAITDSSPGGTTRRVSKRDSAAVENEATRAQLQMFSEIGVQRAIAHDASKDIMAKRNDNAGGVSAETTGLRKCPDEARHGRHASANAPRFGLSELIHVERVTTPTDARANALRNARAIQHIIQGTGDEASKCFDRWLRKMQLKITPPSDGVYGSKGKADLGTMVERAEADARKTTIRLRRDRRTQITNRLQNELRLSPALLPVGISSKSLSPRVSGQVPVSAQRQGDGSSSEFSRQTTEGKDDPSPALRQAGAGGDDGEGKSCPSDSALSVCSSRSTSPSTMNDDARASTCTTTAMVNNAGTVDSKPTFFTKLPQLPYDSCPLAPSFGLDVPSTATQRVKDESISFGGEGSGASRDLVEFLGKKSSRRGLVDRGAVSQAMRRSWKLPEVPRLRYRMRDQSFILGGRWEQRANTDKRFHHDLARTLGLSSEDWNSQSIYNITSLDLKHAAAKKLEQTENTAAILIQQRWRAKLLARETRMVFNTKRVAARRIQCWWKCKVLWQLPVFLRARFRHIRIRAVIRIQAMIRSWLVRRDLMLVRSTHSIQARMRMLIDELHRHHPEETMAAVRIQAAFRGSLSRRRYREKQQHGDHKDQALLQEPLGGMSARTFSHDRVGTPAGVATFPLHAQSRKRQYSVCGIGNVVSPITSRGPNWLVEGKDSAADSMAGEADLPVVDLLQSGQYTVDATARRRRPVSQLPSALAPWLRERPLHANTARMYGLRSERSVHVQRLGLQR